MLSQMALAGEQKCCLGLSVRTLLLLLPQRQMMQWLLPLPASHPRGLKKPTKCRQGLKPSQPPLPIHPLVSRAPCWLLRNIASSRLQRQLPWQLLQQLLLQLPEQNQMLDMVEITWLQPAAMCKRGVSIELPVTSAPAKQIACLFDASCSKTSTLQDSSISGSHAAIRLGL